MNGLNKLNQLKLPSEVYLAKVVARLALYSGSIREKGFYKMD